MHALWLENQTLTYRRDVPVPQPFAGEALVRVRIAGICSTDLELVQGYYPFSGVPGHEFLGEVVEAPGNPGWQGQRVVGEINLACGECAACRAGRRTHCERRRVLGIRQHSGAFAEYLTLPVENLHLVPDGIPDEAAVFAEPLAAALEILEQVSIRPSDRVLLIGAGRLGLLVAQVLALTGCALQVVARGARSQAFLTSRKIPALSVDEVGDHSFDIVVDATGNPQGFILARRAVRARGMLVLKSTYAGETMVNLASLVVDEITVVGSRCGPFPPALRLLAEERVIVSELIEARYPMAQGIAAFAHAARPHVLKVLLTGSLANDPGIAPAGV